MSAPIQLKMVSKSNSKINLNLNKNASYMPDKSINNTLQKVVEQRSNSQKILEGQVIPKNFTSIISSPYEDRTKVNCNQSTFVGKSCSRVIYYSRLQPELRLVRAQPSYELNALRVRDYIVRHLHNAYQHGFPERQKLHRTQV